MSVIRTGSFAVWRDPRTSRVLAEGVVAGSKVTRSAGHDPNREWVVVNWADRNGQGRFLASALPPELAFEPGAST